MKPIQLEKKQRLLDSAIHLFMEKGIDETSVNDIVKDANLAKGTFYIYFKDKAVLIHEIVIKKHLALMDTLIKQAYDQHLQTKLPWSYTFMEASLTFFEQNPKVLKMIHKLMFMDVKESFSILDLYSHVTHFKEFIESFQKQTETKEETLLRFQLILEMCVSVCYNAIFFQQPASFLEVKQMFYTMLCESFISSNGGTL